MNTERSGNLIKLIAVIVIAVVGLFLIGATAGGLGSDGEDENDKKNETENNQVEENNTDKSEENNEAPPSEIPEEKPPEVEEKPVYLSYITGKEISEETYLSRPYACFCDTSASTYGTSYADILFEIPLEYGKTRYIAYISDTTALGKLGAIAPARAYLTEIYEQFGGVLVADGFDDTVDYGKKQSGLHIDLSNKDKYTFTENLKNLYTSSMLLSKLQDELGIDYLSIKKPKMPYVFSENDVYGKTAASFITLPYSENNAVTLTFDSVSCKYKLSRLGKEEIDLLSGETASFDNVFILFASTITYEQATGVETVLNITNGGSGYYISLGKLTEIRWGKSVTEELTFTTLDGNQLEINRGNCYVGYFKAAEAIKVVFQ